MELEVSKERLQLADGRFRLGSALFVDVRHVPTLIDVP
jgi:hypothetical protein